MKIWEVKFIVARMTPPPPPIKSHPLPDKKSLLFFFLPGSSGALLIALLLQFRSHLSLSQLPFVANQSMWEEGGVTGRKKRREGDRERRKSETENRSASCLLLPFLKLSCLRRTYIAFPDVISLRRQQKKGQFGYDFPCLGI